MGIYILTKTFLPQCCPGVKLGMPFTVWAA